MTEEHKPRWSFGSISKRRNYYGRGVSKPKPTNPILKPRSKQTNRGNKSNSPSKKEQNTVDDWIYQSAVTKSNNLLQSYLEKVNREEKFKSRPKSVPSKRVFHLDPSFSKVGVDAVVENGHIYKSVDRYFDNIACMKNSTYSNQYYGNTSGEIGVISQRKPIPKVLAGTRPTTAPEISRAEAKKYKPEVKPLPFIVHNQIIGWKLAKPQQSAYIHMKRVENKISSPSSCTTPKLSTQRRMVRAISKDILRHRKPHSSPWPMLACDVTNEVDISSVSIVENSLGCSKDQQPYNSGGYSVEGFGESSQENVWVEPYLLHLWGKQKESIDS